MRLSNADNLPFHIATLIIFVLAILHIFFANKFTKLANYLADKHHEKRKRDSLEPLITEAGVAYRSFGAELCYFLGEIEVVFGLWVIPLFFVVSYFFHWKVAVEYIDNRDFREAIFVVVVMCITSTKPIVKFVEKLLRRLAHLLGGDTSAWWTTILIVGPLLGSLITEAGAMTLSALLLARTFYQAHPSKKLAYATLGLLFTNVSVGGLLTNFAAAPVLIVSGVWEWSSLYMLQIFGWKAVTGVVLSTLFFRSIFHKEFKKLNHHVHHWHHEDAVPLWITTLHILLLVWVVINAHDPPVFIGSFFLFLGFQQATAPYQYKLNLKRPLLVGFFLAGLIIHGGLQGWWIVPIIQSLDVKGLLLGSLILTPFNDNAAVTYLTSLSPQLTELAKQAVVSGVIVGGGLTVIANAPNPAGQLILKPYFKGGISPLYLFLGAFIPASILFLLFYLTL